MKRQISVAFDLPQSLRDPILPVEKRRATVVYVSGPYTAPTPAEIKINRAIAERVGVELFREGFSPIVPHGSSADMDYYGLDHGVFIAADLHIIERCDALCLLPDWEYSAGAVEEKSHADKLGLAVFHAQVRWEEIPLLRR